VGIITTDKLQYLTYLAHFSVSLFYDDLFYDGLFYDGLFYDGSFYDVLSYDEISLTPQPGCSSAGQQLWCNKSGATNLV